MKRKKKKSLAAADMLTKSAKSKDLKMFAACKSNPKKIFDRLCKKYGSKDDTGLTGLVNNFNECVLKSKKKDPKYWFAELEQINKQLHSINVALAKSVKEVVLHILSNLPKGYKLAKTITEMEDNYLNDLAKIKTQVIKKYKISYRKQGKKGKYARSSKSSSDHDSSSSLEDQKRNRRGEDKLALNIDEEKKDKHNQYGIILCGHYSKPGHGISTC